jgi:hypothetical protein
MRASVRKKKKKKKKKKITTVMPLVLVHTAWLAWNIVAYLWLHPFSVLAFQIALDNSNFSAWQISGTERVVYNYADRATDLVFYAATIAYLWYFVRELWYARWLLPWVAFRAVGNVAYLATLFEPLLAVFANVSEVLMLAYTLLDLLRLDHHVRRRAWLHALLIAVAIGVKVASEIVLHVVRRVDEQPPEPGFPDVWTRFGLRIDVLLLLLFFVVYVGLTAFPSFEPGTVARGEVWMFMKVTPTPTHQQQKQRRAHDRDRDRDRDRLR